MLVKKQNSLLYCVTGQNMAPSQMRGHVYPPRPKPILPLETALVWHTLTPASLGRSPSHMFPETWRPQGTC